MYKGLTVGAVVPAYNEEGYVGTVIDGLPSIVDRAFVIDDGSTDRTWKEIRDHASQRNDAHEGIFDDLVVPIQHEMNRGVGAAIKTGYLAAREDGIDVTAVLGGDDQMDPERLPDLLDPIVEGTAEYTKGNRFSNESVLDRMPRFRLLGNVLLSYLTKIASGYWESMDSQNGYTAISNDALERVDIDGMYEYYGYCNDLLVRLNVADVTIADVPQSSEYFYTDDWKSHIEYSEYIPRVSWMLLHRFLWRLRQKYLFAKFDPIAPLYVVGGTVAGTGLLGLFGSLLRRQKRSSRWFLSTVIGALTLIGAMVRDRNENSALQVTVETRDSVENDGELDEEDVVVANGGNEEHSP